MIKAELTRDYDEVDFCPIFGGDPSPKRWRKFLSGFYPEFRPYAIAIKNALIDNGLIPSYGMSYSNEFVFTFSDGSKPVGLSTRAWGDFVSAIVGKKEGYMRYY